MNFGKVFLFTVKAKVAGFVAHACCLPKGHGYYFYQLYRPTDEAICWFTPEEFLEHFDIIGKPSSLLFPNWISKEFLNGQKGIIQDTFSWDVLREWVATGFEEGKAA